MSNAWQHARSLWRDAEERPAASRGAVLVLRRHYAEPGLVERMARFEDFFAQTNGRPSEWGKTDCTLRIADWVVENGHDDPADGWRGTYSDEAQCRAMLAARGGLIGHVTSCAAAIGLVAIAEPEFGSISVIGATNNSDRQWSAIWNGARWLVLWGDERSAVWKPFAARPLGMWRV